MYFRPRDVEHISGAAICSVGENRKCDERAFSTTSGATTGSRGEIQWRSPATVDQSAVCFRQRSKAVVYPAFMYFKSSGEMSFASAAIVYLAGNYQLVGHQVRSQSRIHDRIICYTDEARLTLITLTTTDWRKNDYEIEPLYVRSSMCTNDSRCTVRVVNIRNVAH